MDMINKLPQIYTNDSLYKRIGINFHSKYQFGKLTKFYDRVQEISQLERGNTFIQSLKGKYKGKRCFIIGNGPSLNEQDLTLLKDEFTIGSNYIYMNYENMGFYPTIFTIVNYLVAEQRINEINDLPESIKIFPYFLNYMIKEDKRTFFLNSAAIKEFSTDLTKNISWQSTVTFFNMQLAYYLGFDEVYLIGVDNSYIQPKDGNEGAMIDQKEDDPNHFCGTYFKGLTWQKADTDAMEYVYFLTKEVFDQSSQNIYNATYGGRLEVFERIAYETLFTQENKTKATTKIETSIDHTNKTVLISINPDLENKFGHYLHFDQSIQDNLPENCSMYILSNKKLLDELGKIYRNILPTFKNYSWNIGLPEQRNEFYDEVFKAELLNAIRIFGSLNGTKKFYFYTGSLNHAEIINELIKEYSLDYEFHINLFREHFNINFLKENKEKTLKLLTELENRNHIKLYIDSDEMNKEFQNILGLTFARWPMFSITDFSVNTGEFLKKKQNQQTNVVFPGNLRLEKGFDMAVACANALSNKEFNVYIRSTIQNVNSKEVMPLLDKINKKVNIVTGVLSENEFISFMKLADIIVLPYRVSEFKTRTSGLMADAIHLEKPVVAARGTFMGNIIDKYHNGETFIDGDSNSIQKAIERIVENIEDYKSAAKKCKLQWHKNNNIDSLLTNTFQLRGKIQ